MTTVQIQSLAIDISTAVALLSGIRAKVGDYRDLLEEQSYNLITDSYSDEMAKERIYQLSELYDELDNATETVNALVSTFRDFEVESP